MKSIFTILALMIMSIISTGQRNVGAGGGDNFLVRMINDLVISPDGKYATFNAVGKIKLLDLKSNKCKDLISSTVDFEFEPAFSHDSQKIIFSSWNESGYGKLHIWDKGTNRKKTILVTSGIYRSAAFSPDGTQIVYKKEIEVGKVDTINQQTEGLYVFTINEGDPIKISGYGDYPQFSQDGKRIIYQSGTYRLGSFVKTFETVDLNGENKQVLFYGKYGHEYAISPNQKMVAWQELGKIYISSFPQKSIGLTADNVMLQKQLVTDLPGNNLSWSKDNKQLSWSIANTLYSVNPKQDKSLNVKQLMLKEEVAKPKGVLAFTNARIINMKGDEIIEGGTIIVKENKIVDVGVGLKIPKEAHVMNCSGKTIMPGLIDLNPASNNYDYNLSPIKQWEYIDLLKSGITTKLDGSFQINHALTNRELVLAEKLIGPRLLNGGVTITKLDSTIFYHENSFKHFVKSNLMIASAFAVTAIQSEIELEQTTFLVLDNMQGDGGKVQREELHNMMIQNMENGDQPYTILKKYTIHNAELIGMHQQLGSLVKGKLADFIILNGNPLEDMSHIKSLVYTVINGRIYDTSTMQEVGNYQKKISHTVNSAAFESLNRTMRSACCGFQH